MSRLHWLRTQRGTAVAVIVTMALGIGAAIAVYAVVEAVVLRSMPVRDGNRLVWMWNARVERDRAPFSALDLADYRQQNTVLDGLAPFINWTANLTGLGDAERLEGVRVDPGFFDLLGVPAAAGRMFTATDVREPVAVITNNLWRRRFGADQRAVGQVVSLNGTGYTIVGILPPGFLLPFRDAEVAVPLSLESDPRRSDRGAGFLRVVARLKTGVSIEAAKANLDAIAARLRRDYPDANSKKVGVNLFALDREIIGDARSLLLTLMGAVVLLLLVACANIANLLLVAYAARRRELTLRNALGATRARIMRQILGEVGALVVAGGLAGLLVARSLARVLVWWGATSLPRLDGVHLTLGVSAFALLAIAASAFVCGLVPAWLLSDAPATGLADDGRTAAGGAAQGRYRRAFVVTQLASALMLIVAVATTARSFAKLQAVEPGFDGHGVLSAQLALPPSRYARPVDLIRFADTLQTDLLKLDGSRETAAISLMPLTGLLSTQDYRVLGQPEPPPDEIPQAHYRIATPRYFQVMKIALEGREFDDDDRETTRRVAIISRSFADRHWPRESAIGGHVVVGRDTLEVVGVCADVKQFGLDGARTADLYIPLRQMPANQAQFLAARMYWLVATDRDPSRLVDAVRAAVRRVDKDVAASSVRPLQQVVAASIGARRFNVDLISTVGVASLVIALIGVYSISAFSLSSRTREIGIRLTLGGTPSQVLRPILAGELKLVALGIAFGCAGAIGISAPLSRGLFATKAVEPTVIAGSALLLLVAALAASYIPVRRALSSDPVTALRVD